MITIVKAAKVFRNIIGEQEIKNTEYKKAIQLLIVKKDGYLLYNAITKELILLNEQEFSDFNSSTINTTTPSNQELIRKWFLLPTDFDEYKFSDQIVSFSRNLQKESPVIGFNILTTTACNARCFYCYEAGAKKTTMTKETADQVVRFIKKNSQGKKVKLTWFGGEPLCNFKIIDYISSALKNDNVDFISKMTSNAFLFDKELCMRAKSLWNLTRIQITLDGPEKTYNRVKNYVSDCESPFKRVIRNIDMLSSNHIRVIIRLNMDNYNYYDLIELIDFLSERYRDNPYVFAYAHLIFENMGFEKTVHTTEERITLGEKYRYIRKLLREKGLTDSHSHISNHITTYRCMADNPSSVQILPDGHLTRCEHEVDSNFVGDVFSTYISKPWTDYPKRLEKCTKCAYYSDCLMLSKCPDWTGDCNENQRLANIEGLQYSMLCTYNDYKEKGN